MTVWTAHPSAGAHSQHVGGSASLSAIGAPTKVQSANMTAAQRKAFST